MAADDNILNTPGLMDPSTEFGSMMQHAMKIKGAQMEQERKMFETWPTFFQNTMWMQGRALELRPMPVSGRLPEAIKLKEDGNSHFREKSFAQAIEQYEQALGSFKYAKQLDPDWKKKGIRDETIEVVEDFGEGDERDAVIDFCVSCYNNLAACYLGRASAGVPHLGSSIEGDYALCIAACDCALELQPSCAKALYRRARARTEPLSAGASAMDEAIKDLSAAARHSPDDKAVRVLLSKMRRERAEQRAKDTSTFSGMFGRGEIYDAKSLEEQKARVQAEQKQLADADKKRTVADCEREAREAEEVVRSLHARGKREDAEALAAKLEEHKRQLTEYKRAASEVKSKKEIPQIDFRNPTAEQIEDAKKHGVDLFDPLVVEELERLQQEQETRTPTDGSAGAAGRAGARSTVRHRRRRPPPPDVTKIPLHEIRRRLDDMGVDYSTCSDRPSLEEKLLAQYTSEPEEYESETGCGSSFDDDDDYRDGWGWWTRLQSWGCALL